jgi:hypothetical protein
VDIESDEEMSHFAPPGAPADAWAIAHYEHAFMLRCEGATYREIGRRLGITGESARYAARRFGYILGKRMRKVKWPEHYQDDWTRKKKARDAFYQAEIARFRKLANDR